MKSGTKVSASSSFGSGGGAAASAQMEAYCARGLEYVDALAAKIALLEKFEAHTGVKKRWFLLAGVTAVVLVVTLDLFSAFIASVAGLLYPAYASFRAIESRKLDDNTQWLMYWVVFAAFSFLENFSTVVLYYVPWFYKIKTATLVLLQLPGSPVTAALIYKQYIKPLIMQLRQQHAGAAKNATGTNNEVKTH